ncbi:hypothetical protein [Nevskia ramosa]|uniref:hypothetical protein n=1 Tax=Nevskia ramosa TaxID=64002 RepID=UPI003D0F70B0
MLVVLACSRLDQSLSLFATCGALFRAFARVTFFKRMKKVTKEVRPTLRVAGPMKLARRCPALLGHVGAF